MVSDLQLRRTMDARLRTDADFNAFCQDCFPAVFHRFSDGMDRVAKTTLLLHVVDDTERIAARLELWLDRDKQHWKLSSREYAIGVSLLLSSLFGLTLLIFGRTDPPSATTKITAFDQQALEGRQKAAVSVSPAPNKALINQCPQAPASTQSPAEPARPRGLTEPPPKTILNVIQGPIKTLIQNY